MPLINKAGGGGADTSVVTASAADILAGKVIVDANGNSLTGTMTNRGAVSQTLNTSTTSYTIPAGYHNGSGKVSITTETKTATPSTSAQTITPSSGKVLSSVTVNAMTTATQATPSITVSDAGLITASATQTAGYVAAGTKSATKQLTVQAAKTVTPTTSSQTAVASGVYTTGAVTVAGDANLVAENIASGVSIFGVSGTLVPIKGTTGSFKVSSTRYSYTVSGLGFQPKYVSIVKYSGGHFLSCTCPLSSISKWFDKSFISNGSAMNEWLAGHYYYYEDGYEYVDYDFSKYNVTATSDGFTLTANSTYGDINKGNTFYYFAIA